MRLAPLLALCAASFLSAPAHAGCMGWGPEQTDTWHYSLGVSGAYVNHQGHGFGANLDLTASYSLFSVTLNGKFVQEGPRSLWGAQLELSMYLLVSLGLGIGYLGGSQEGPLVHGFVGVPIPLSETKLGRRTVIPYLEPYYRLGGFLPSDRWQVMHEVGLFVKAAVF